VSDPVTDFGLALTADLTAESWGVPLEAEFAYAIAVEPHDCRSLRVLVVPRLWVGDPLNRAGDAIEEVSFYVCVLQAVENASVETVWPLLDLVRAIARHYENPEYRSVGGAVVTAVERPNPILDADQLLRGLFKSAPAVTLKGPA